MKDTLVVPKTLKVGFQNRKDTYSGRLAYVVYLDHTGKLRKEASWTSWRDKKIEPLELENEPMSGFVLNHQVGGAKDSYSSWNVRIEKVRVYDPRGFEFEITVPNLLFILQECSAIKGKGLEGDFVYSWDRSELVLLPVSSQEYQKALGYTKLQASGVSAKDLKVGHVYLNKKQEELIYMGRHIWWGMPTRYASGPVGKKRHVFAYHTLPKNFYGTKGSYSEETGYLVTDGVSGIAKEISAEVSTKYAEIHDALMKSCLLSKPVRFLGKAAKPIKIDSWAWNIALGVKIGEGFALTSVRTTNSYGKPKDENTTYSLDDREDLSIVDGRIRHTWTGGRLKSNLTLDQVNAMAVNIMVQCENGAVSTII